MLGGLGNMAGMLKQAKELQTNMKKMQEALEAKRHEADAGAGMVKATVNGKSELVQIKIDPKAVDDVELLEDLVLAAVGAASKKAQDAATAEMSELTGGLNLPGLSDMLGQGT